MKKESEGGVTGLASCSPVSLREREESNNTPQFLTY